MEGYLGDFDVDLEESPFKNFSPFDWAMYFIEKHGQTNAPYHKAWVIDQIARLYNGTKPIVKLAKWKNGETEYRVVLDVPTEKYLSWVESMKYEDGEEQYSYDEGRAP